ncbi:hypothetical protein AB0393_38145 [Streptomyces cyaneofuscatus]
MSASPGPTRATLRPHSAPFPKAIRMLRRHLELVVEESHDLLDREPI